MNYRMVCETLGRILMERGHRIVLNARVTKISPEGSDSRVIHTSGDVAARVVVNCAGLQCDRVTRMAGHQPPAKIVPFRGEYYELKPEAEHLCRHLIYPVPDPKFPFLGVHFTRMITGGVECGPNAVLAFAREGYSRTKVNLPDLFESLTYSGFLRMAMKHWRMGMGEMHRSFSKAAFVRALQRLMPDLKSEHLLPAPSGVRAQAVLPDGSMVDDFLILEEANVVHVNNAPSPAATASLNIGKLVSEKVLTRFH